jgi:hypothetical protein
LLEEFDGIPNKKGLGSLIKTLSSENVKFGICGVGPELADLLHASTKVAIYWGEQRDMLAG